MMDDLELTKLAARACGGHLINANTFGDLYQIGGREVFWAPLLDDGDAFRLMLKLQIKVEYWPESDSVLCSLPGSMGATTVGAMGDIELRRAIVRAAAIVGECMP